MTLKLLIHKAEEGGYWAEIPSLPGCFTQGENLEELKINAKEAVEGWLQAREQQLDENKDAQVIELLL
ncbi:MAG TPA: type II toxin-antitoxin system HicB family antitoxin [Ignavibacteria bacterium]|jgi:predicted RNase H-like HicB family nuclease